MSKNQHLKTCRQIQTFNHNRSMPRTIADIELELAALTEEREQLLLKFSIEVKAKLVQRARDDGARHWIEQYTTNRRLLGYLNRLPQELGRYADALEGLVRADKFCIGDSVAAPLPAIEDSYYLTYSASTVCAALDSWYKQPTYIVDKIRNKVPHLLKPTVVETAKAWVKMVKWLVPARCKYSWWQRFANLTLKKLELVVHVRGLANIIKSAEFHEAVKAKIKEDCRVDVANIEIRILGVSAQTPYKKTLAGVVVIPDVEDKDYFINDFLSDTSIRNNVKELAAQFPDLLEYSIQASTRLEQIKQMTDKLEKEIDDVQSLPS